MWQRLRRRTVLSGGLVGLGAALAGCASASPPGGTPSRPAAPSSPASAAEAELSRLEATFGGRLGICAVDTGSGASVRHRAGERFLMCSTFKALAVSAILRRRQQQPGLLDTVIRYDRSQLLPYAPVTSQHVAEGMTVSALCQAAITYSDNTAANLLLQVLGGPPAVTAFARTLGDQLTRLDRTEPDLNVTAAGDQRDTSTPAQMAADLRVLALGDGLDPAGRDLLVGWLKANTTGGRSIRAGLPAGWQVGDKTGSGAQGETNDIAVVWPPNHAPLVIAVYTAPADPKSTAGYATVARAATIVANALVPTG
ncbi:class A beta-lactamase [Gandjariella thermophila]|uniref:Beta-lactamase n=1 Tax=Gandjariella thermophila TaxID=1931992 RepID=A0A4D4JAA5_9PSEU|nr:class A beta-lactamase [Gandjariella thermophila]GDY31339.1 beta-lactamase [Gandjariella thermophila]